MNHLQPHAPTLFDIQRLTAGQDVALQLLIWPADRSREQIMLPN
jgi:hypothetical protein